MEITTPKKSRAKKIILVVAIVLIVLVLALLIAIPYMIMPMFLGQRFEQEQYTSADFGISSEQITLVTDDELSIAAWRTKADASKGTVIILSGIENPSVTAFFGYAKLLADNGWDALLIEMRARSESEGDEIGLGMTEWLDVKAGVDYLGQDESIEGLPIVALGTSMGAGTVIIAAGEVPEIDAVISISAFSSWTNMFVEYMSMAGIPKALSTLEKPFVNLYSGFHYGFDALAYSPMSGIAKLNERPILLMHSTEDSQVPFSEFEILLSIAQSNGINASTFIREGDEHFICYEQYFNNPEDDGEFSGAILEFLNINFQ
ncbi:alpha/beta hydrolase [Ohessyouella blattaphilus]|uniref:Prolyl oligopeptidase family serine peptidase n=1 Tax=Ohessyouella blattaphilus TaxID=2949333 RepID=A0ABT1EGF6_9FIRM|nr:prolyl oligopeptidase family serine peptidase [Ohessyouella blattaphilus]MCP1109738.1 prolyl oligopeptidase family serine peptidase [Ohessyouella blattaphilus]MCR8563132.1 prolyl oligopeptidase family serine peptidase [Ohessyouella blattaphilus]